MMNNKGAITDLFVWIAAAVVIVGLSGMILFGWGEFTQQLGDIPIVFGQRNLTQITDDTFGKVNVSFQQLKWGSYLLILTLGISILVSNFLVKAHPVFFIPYILMVVAAVMVSIFISNGYESLLGTDQALAGTLLGFSGSNNILLNLPLWVAVIGIFGGIFLFIGIIRDRGQGGGL